MAKDNRTITIKVMFWTNNIHDTKKEPLAKAMWDRGVVVLEANDTHGIKPSRSIPFNSLAEIPAKIEELLIRHGLTVYTSPKMSKYIQVTTPREKAQKMRKAHVERYRQ